MNDPMMVEVIWLTAAFCMLVVGMVAAVWVLEGRWVVNLGGSLAAPAARCADSPEY